MKKEKWWRKLKKTLFSDVAEFDQKHFTYIIVKSKVEKIDIINCGFKIGMGDYTLVLGVRGIWMKPEKSHYDLYVHHDVVHSAGFRDADLDIVKKDK